jgi:glycosyltransferase involved in cell wall biosynthesis
MNHPTRSAAGAQRPPVRTIALMIPTLNEIDGLRVTLPQIDRSLFDEIVVVDGRSTDGTIEFCRENGLTVIIQPRIGMPDAEEAAFKTLKSDAFVLYTPDGNSMADLLPQLCEHLRAGYDMVIASRYLGEATSEDDDVFTGFGNSMFTGIINLLFGARYTDALVGMRAYRADAVRKMRLVGMGEENFVRRKFWRTNSWEVGSTIRAARLGLRTLEIPGPEPKRIGGVRKLSVIKNGMSCATQILLDFLLFRPGAAERDNGGTGHRA